MQALPRGISLNNPGNIEYRSDTPWQGLDTPPSDGRFCRFTSPQWGIRAMARTLIAYQDKAGIRTIGDAIARWAPPSDNNPTEAYALSVAKAAGVNVGDAVDFHSYAILRAVVPAIIRQENGQQPYSAAVIDEGLRRAGVVRPVSMAPTATAARALVAPESVAGATGTVGGTLIAASQQVQAVAGESKWLTLAGVALLVAGALLGAWAVWRRARVQA